MTPRHHSHPAYMRWFKSILAILAFVYPLYMLLSSIPGSVLTGIIEITMLFLMMVSILVTAYFFQDIWVDQEGLQIEFLWKKIRVRWVDIVEIRSAWGFLGQENKRPLIVLVNGLTPFHRAFGIIYALSTKPGFVIFPSISDFELLKDAIQSRVRR